MIVGIMHDDCIPIPYFGCASSPDTWLISAQKYIFPPIRLHIIP